MYYTYPTSLELPSAIYFLNSVTSHRLPRISETTEYFINIFFEILDFILADKGYDVWLGNARGFKYLNLTTSEPDF